MFDSLAGSKQEPNQSHNVGPSGSNANIKVVEQLGVMQSAQAIAPKTAESRGYTNAPADVEETMPASGSKASLELPFERNPNASSVDGDLIELTQDINAQQRQLLAKLDNMKVLGRLLFIKYRRRH